MYVKILNIPKIIYFNLHQYWCNLANHICCLFFPKHTTFSTNQQVVSCLKWKELHLCIDFDKRDIYEFMSISLIQDPILNLQIKATGYVLCFQARNKHKNKLFIESYRITVCCRYKWDSCTYWLLLKINKKSKLRDIL